MRVPFGVECESAGGRGLAAGCYHRGRRWPEARASAAMATESDRGRAHERRHMVDTQIRARGVRHAGVLRAMAAVPRHEFVPAVSASAAYEDRPLPIGYGQTISQALHGRGDDRGAGAGGRRPGARGRDRMRLPGGGAGASRGGGRHDRMGARAGGAGRRDAGRTRDCQRAGDGRRRQPRRAGRAFRQDHRHRRGARPRRARSSTSWPSAAGWCCRAARRGTRC